MAKEELKPKQKTWQQNSLEAILIGGSTYLLYKMPPALIDTYYSNGIYKPIAGIEGMIGDAMPFSIIEALFATGMICLAYRTGKGIISGARKTREIFRKIKEQTTSQIASETLNYLRQFSTTLAESTASIAKKGAICVLALTTLGGLNISRTHIIDKIKVQPQTTIDLEELTTRTRKIIPQIHGTKFEKQEFTATLEKALDDTYYQINKTKISAYKKIKQSRIPLRKAGIGAFSLASFECIVDTSVQDDFTIWSVIHEQAHARGYMREADAEALSYAACLTSNNNVLKYVATLHLFYLSIDYLAIHEPQTLKHIAVTTKDEELKDILTNYSKQPKTGMQHFFDIIFSKIQQIRGSKNVDNAYITETVPALWAIDKAYAEGKLK